MWGREGEAMGDTEGFRLKESGFPNAIPRQLLFMALLPWYTHRNPLKILRKF
jgi:hypothetical protein